MTKIEDCSSYIKVSESAQDTDGEVNPIRAYYNGSLTSKDTEDPSWSTSFKTRRTQKTSSTLEALWKTLFCLVSMYLMKRDCHYAYLPVASIVVMMNDESDICEQIMDLKKSTYFVRDLQGNDLLMGTHESDLYTIILQDLSSPTLIFLLAKASPTQAWFWQRRLFHLDFDTINMLSKNDIVNGLPKFKFVKDQLFSSYVVDKAKRSCFKTIAVTRSKKRDGENLDKMKEKGDPCIFVGYSTQSKGYRVYNKRTRLIVESIHVNFDEIKVMTSDHNSLGLAPQRQLTPDDNTSGLAPQLQKTSDHNPDITKPSLQELDFLSSPLFKEYFAAGNQSVSKPSALFDNSQQQDNTSYSGEYADHAGCLDTRKSTYGGIQFLGKKLVSWMSKKQDCTAMSIAEAEYLALSASCA
ncbi:integrase, catalytic region, zinc finger, CCHC-type containing protein [Tanacetum coccineum]